MGGLGGMEIAALVPFLPFSKCVERPGLSLCRAPVQA